MDRRQALFTLVATALAPSSVLPAPIQYIDRTQWILSGAFMPFDTCTLIVPPIGWRLNV